MSDDTRKRYRIHWALPLAYLCLTAAIVMISQRPAETVMPVAGSRNARAITALPGKQRLREHPSVTRMARVREWMNATALKEHPDDFQFRMGRTVKALTKDDLHQLLSDLDRLFAPGKHFRFPIRYALQNALWERYGELSPDEALKLAFPDGKPSPDRRISSWNTLSGVAKTDPERSYGVLKVQLIHFSVDDVFGTPIHFALSETLAEWAKFAPEQAFAAIRDFPGKQAIAYQGYTKGLAAGTIWQDEAARFETIAHNMPPDAAGFLASRWVIFEPQAAFDWIQQNGPSGTDFSTSMVVSLLRGSPEVAGKWLASRSPDGIDKQAAILGALHWDGLEDESFTSVALPLITDPQQRDRVVMENLGTANEKPLRFLASSTLLSEAVRQSAAAKLNEIEARFAKK